MKLPCRQCDVFYRLGTRTSRIGKPSRRASKAGGQSQRGYGNSRSFEHSTLSLGQPNVRGVPMLFLGARRRQRRLRVLGDAPCDAERVYGNNTSRADGFTLKQWYEPLAAGI